ncbi:hypothetical protein AOQ84DRAFT_342003 [Glonium stellatum]|uniref:peptidylprolyl isomerase n=1 Tax=Glonium stellatum TaxID=574774 RepID=A0A8E2EZ35_9PEZI|nr:hypothetical protein AOQ84DRAFT_342003 [Glonium stellatum]
MGTSSPHLPNPRNMTFLDLHTAEAPIKLSSANMDLTMSQLRLKDCTINDVLNIYAVERKVFQDNLEESSGKDGIFGDSAAWEHPVSQSERGRAMMLSSLRVFTELVGARNMEIPAQDAILHIFNLLTRFPPAVRTVHILMSGKSPRPCERAALTQALYEILKEVVPRPLIKSNNSRILEGTRLLFGLVLEKAKHLKISARDQDGSPYMKSMKVLDLRNTFTMEPIASPIQTTDGLVEEGYYEALQDSGILNWTDGVKLTPSLAIDARTKRTVLLCGGVIPQVTIFDMDSLDSMTRYVDGGDVDRVIISKELTDTQHLAALCSRNKLGVLPPSTLPSAEHPALTLDREGLLAVYVGRPACAAPGKDIAIFRPTRGGEEHVDVSIITQLLIPILERRNADGTAIFDAFGDQNRQLKDPDEIIMLCVDCSGSMREPSDFLEMLDEESPASSDIDEYPIEDEVNGSMSVDDNESTAGLMTLDELKASLGESDSFSDMLSIVKFGATTLIRRRNAEKVVKIMDGLTSQELKGLTTQLEKLKVNSTRHRYRTQAESLAGRIAKLKDLKAHFNRRGDIEALCDFLVYRAENSEILDEPLTWRIGDAVPRVPKAVPDTTSSALARVKYSMPPEYLCPISQELLEDPVISCDGFTFERKNIERWFQIRQSSPLTGLVLENTDLRHNGRIANAIKTWVEANDILDAAQSALYPNPSSSMHPVLAQGYKVDFLGPLGSFNRLVVPSLTLEDLYLVAFRGMKGRHIKFELHSKNTFLEPSGDMTIASTNIRNGSVLHITVQGGPTTTDSASTGITADSNAEFEDLCLVKIYHGYNNVVTSYWVPATTTKTLTSVVFRYWTEMFKHGSPVPQDFVLWTNLVDEGDSRFVGQTQDHWEPLSKFLNPWNATGKLREELAYDKKNHTAEDDSDDSDMDHDVDQGQPLVLKINLGYGPAKPDTKTLSRLDVLKQMFDAFVNRLLAYNFQTHMGLITFHSTTKVSQNITHAVENFRHKLNDMTASGDTSLWDALALANDQLNQYALRFPSAKKRIICLSDGMDTNSKRRAHEISYTLLQSKIVVDSFCLGDVDNEDLRTVAYLSGGYKFQPESLEQAMAICEMEPVLSQLERPTIVLPRASQVHTYDTQLRFVWAKEKAIPEIVTRDEFPERKAHPNFDDRFVELTTIMKSNSSGASRSWTGMSSDRSNANLRTSRILTEIRNIVASPHPHYDVYVSESNMAFWKVVMQGPPESAYADGVFVLYLDMEDNYPAFPPKGRFSTPIYHPNINRHGRICHSILDRNWTADTTSLQVINTIYSLLLVPEFSDPINAVVTLDYHWDEVQFKDEVNEHILKHATTTRAEWRAELLEE